MIPGHAALVSRWPLAFRTTSPLLALCPDKALEGNAGGCATGLGGTDGTSAAGWSHGGTRRRAPPCSALKIHQRDRESILAGSAGRCLRPEAMLAMLREFDHVPAGWWYPPPPPPPPPAPLLLPRCPCPCPCPRGLLADAAKPASCLSADLLLAVLAMAAVVVAVCLCANGRGDSAGRAAAQPHVNKQTIDPVSPIKSSIFFLNFFL